MSEVIEMMIGIETISVRYKDRLENLKPVVYISKDEANPIVIAVGSFEPPTKPHIQIDLFCPGASLPKSIEKDEVLTAFFAYIFRDMLNLRKSPLIDMLKPSAHPRVILKGAESLDSILCGYHKSLLRNALIKVGAKECVFAP